jgi:DNA-binding NtrC family response regulator
MNSLPHALIVEDLDFWKDTLYEVLIDAGYWVQAASNYDEALAVLAQDGFHLAVIDPVLDDTDPHNRDGLRVLQHILNRHSAICAIVVTSSDPMRIRREVSEIAADVPVLRKDEWDDGRFLTIVRDLLSRKGI